MDIPIKTSNPLGVAVVTFVAGMSTLFFATYERTAAIEGGYSNHADDLGGKTMHGITEGVARDAGYEGAIAAMPETTAVRIAWERYWQPLHLDSIAATDSAYTVLASGLYDYAFNTGPLRAGKALQRCLNSLNRRGELWPDVAVDGVVGSVTLAAFHSYAAFRGADGAPALTVCVKSVQGEWYLTISELRPENQTFTQGWYNRLARYE